MGILDFIRGRAQPEIGADFQHEVQESSIPSNWFDDIHGSKALSTSEGKLAAKYAEALILDDEKKISEYNKLFKKDHAPRIVFLSISDGNTPACVSIGCAEGITHAIQKAKKGLFALISNQYTPRWIKVDIVHDVSPLGMMAFNKVLETNRGIHGIAFSQSSGLAYLPQEVVAKTYISKKQKLQMKNIKKHTSKHSAQYTGITKLIREGKSEMYKFTTTSYIIDEDDAHLLYRGHRLFAKLSNKEILDAANIAGDYLERNVNTSGSFVYSYMPKLNNVPETYNILRHAGAIYSMLELYEVTQNNALLQKSKLAIQYLLKQIRDFKVNNNTFSVVVDKDFIKLGGNALACLALVKYTQVTDDQQHLPLIRSMGDWIESTQDENGKFTIHKQSISTHTIENFESGYYPGEAIFALTRIYQIDPNKKWLDVAEKAADYLINVRDKNIPGNKLIHDHWLLYGLSELFGYRENKIYIEHTQKIVSAILSTQQLASPFKDWIGGFYNPPRSTPTAVRAEGLCAAYQLLADQGYKDEAAKILNAIKLCINFQLQTQFRPENAMYLKKPERVIGGFSKSLSHFEIRIDYVQHNISALLGLLRICSA